MNIKILFYFGFFTLVLGFFITTTYWSSEDSGEKHEWSILQVLEYKSRDLKSNKPYLIFENALKTKYTVIALPLKSKPMEYTFILNKSDGPSKVKILPESEFVINQKTYDYLRNKIFLSEEVKAYLRGNINGLQF